MDAGMDHPDSHDTSEDHGPVFGIIAQGVNLSLPSAYVALFGVFIIMCCSYVTSAHILDRKSPSYLVTSSYSLVDLLNALIALSVLLVWHVKVNDSEAWGLEYDQVTTHSLFALLFCVWVIFVLSYTRSVSTKMLFMEKIATIKVRQAAGTPLLVLSVIIPFMLFDSVILMNSNTDSLRSRNLFKFQLGILRDSIPGVAKSFFLVSWILVIVRYLVKNAVRQMESDTTRITPLPPCADNQRDQINKTPTQVSKTYVFLMFTAYWASWFCLYCWMESNAATIGVKDAVPIIFIFAILINRIAEMFFGYNDMKERSLNHSPSKSTQNALIDV